MTNTKTPTCFGRKMQIDWLFCYCQGHCEEQMRLIYFKTFLIEISHNTQSFCTTFNGNKLEPVKSLIRFTFVIALWVKIEVTDFSTHLIARVCSFSRIFLQSVQIIQHSNQSKSNTCQLCNFMYYGETRIKRSVFRGPSQLRWEGLGMELGDY